MKTRLALLLVLITISASAQLGAKVQQNKITGTWVNNQFGVQMTLMLNADGSGNFDGEQIKYVAEDGKLTFTIVADNETNIYNYEVKGNSLTVSGGDMDQPMTFTRQGTEQQQQPSDGSASASTQQENSSVGDKALIGVWSGNGETIEFKSNGEVVYLGNTFRYQASQRQLTLITGQANLMMVYSIQGTHLTLVVNGTSVVYTRGANNNNSTASTGGKSVPQELVGKWCWVNVTNTNSGGSQSEECITLNGNGTYSYYSERSSSVTTNLVVGGTNSQGGDQGTWWVEGDRIFYNSQSRGQGSYRLEKRNHPKNVNDPMIVLDGQPYVTQYQKAPWR